jgi:hypothetical protein
MYRLRLTLVSDPESISPNKLNHPHRMPIPGLGKGKIGPSSVRRMQDKAEIGEAESRNGKSIPQFREFREFVILPENSRHLA